MHTFADHAGRIWTVCINVYAVKRVRAVADLDLYSLVDDKFEGLSGLLADPCKLVDVLYVLCKDEAEKLGVSDEDFGRGLGGDSLERATSAFLEELTDFFPDPRVRAGMGKVLAAGRRLAGKLMDHAMASLDGIDLDREAEILIASSGSSPASSASTPDPSPSANSA